jgi:two-component system response regulator PilR (NtrC family)
MVDAPVVLVVDDEPGLRDVLSITLRRQGYEVVCMPGVKSALEAIAAREEPFPLVITDLVMPGGSGMEVLEAARERSSGTQVILMTAFSTVESAIEAMREGAYDFVTKPFSPAEMALLASKALEKSTIVQENRQLRARLASMLPDDDEDEALFGSDPAMRTVETLVRKAASTRTTVFITGESGTGKERVARILHELSERANGPLCVINCGALPEALMESELFGHEKGAFTGAATAAIGLFRQADGGTILLDEICELPLALQVKLLRVLQERKVRPVGSATEVDVDVRLIAATNRDVEKDVADGRFRQDLYYRLNVIRVELPPLRDRPRDIARLAKRMVIRFANEFDKEADGITARALRTLERYDFPGNIRELENMMERAVALASHDTIDVSDLPDTLTSVHASRAPAPRADLPDDGCNIDEVLEHTERSLLTQALERSDGVRKNAAALLGITFRSLRYRLAKLGMDNDKNDDRLPSSSKPSSTDPSSTD